MEKIWFTCNISAVLKARQEAKYLINFCYLSDVSNVELNIPTNITHLWSFVNGLLKAMIMMYNGQVLTSTEAVCEALAQHLHTINNMKLLISKYCPMDPNLLLSIVLRRMKL